MVMKTLDKILKKKIGEIIYISFDEGESVKGELVEVDKNHFTLKQYGSKCGICGIYILKKITITMKSKMLQM